MDIHENARTTPHSRAEIVRRVIEEGESRSRVAQAFGVCCKTVNKWVDRFLTEGPEGLRERSSRPHGTVLNFVLAACFHYQTTNLSPKTTANWVFASNHSRGARFHSWAA